jgi:hypothetical protein
MMKRRPTIVRQYNGVSRIYDCILCKVSILAEALHLRLSCCAPAVVDILARIAVETALYCADEAHWIVFLELGSDVTRSCTDNAPRCLVSDCDWALTDDKALLVRFCSGLATISKAWASMRPRGCSRSNNEGKWFLLHREIVRNACMLAKLIYVVYGAEDYPKSMTSEWQSEAHKIFTRSSCDRGAGTGTSLRCNWLSLASLCAVQ